MKPHDSKEIAGDRVEFTLDSVEPAPASTKSTTVETAERPTTEKRSEALRWLIFGAAAASTAGIVVMLAFPDASTTTPARVTPTVVAASAPSAPVATATPEIESTPPPTWTGAQRASWAHDGSKTITFSLAATRDLPVWMNQARPTLVVRCLSRTTEVFVMLDTSISHEQDVDRRTVRVQWDDGPQNTQYWGVSDSARELFAPDGKAFVLRAATARTLRFGFTPFNTSPVTAEFAVQGFDKMAGMVASTCGWRLAPAS